MATGLKRKRSDDDVDGFGDMFDLDDLSEATGTPPRATVKQSVKKKKINERRKKKQDLIKVPRKELFKTLPGEIRNVIYDLVLLPDTFEEAKMDVHYRRPSRNYIGYRRFEEPGLLRAAKWIREEAKGIFYGSHKFVISVGSDNVEAACNWFRAIACLNKHDYVFPPSIRIGKANWDDSRYWLPLAKLFSEFDFDLQ